MSDFYVRSKGYGNVIISLVLINCFILFCFIIDSLSAVDNQYLILKFWQVYSKGNRPWAWWIQIHEIYYKQFAS